jgi:hypothetical protein
LIWIAPDFSSEHRAALEWLNQWTADEIEAYGVEVTAVRIEDSLPAPIFSIVVAPSVRVDRTEAASNRPMTRRQFYSRFYGLLNSELANEGIYPIAPTQGGWVHRYRQYHSDYPGISYASIHDPDDGHVYVGFRTWDENGENVIERLRESKSEVEVEISGVEVDWQSTELWASKPASYNDSEAEHAATREWMFDTLVSLRNAIQPRLDAIMDELHPTE